jgi:2-keto-4-pentenoate hydratase/2-oxohepta-3-ene-1,7-dioic acid hydratase in catechol pathway
LKLLRYGPAGQEQPGMLDLQGQIRSLTGVIADLTPLQLSDEALDRLRTLDPATLPLAPADSRFGLPITGTGKVVCVGLNYRDHADETGAAYPPEPILFMKATSALQGPNDEVWIPRGSVKTDWEVELAVVIGTAAKYVEAGNALSYVAGYCVMNDLSEREFQIERGGQWDKGKCCDTFGPLGPYLVTRDEVPDPQNLPLWLEVDGHRFQNGNTRNMIFGVADLVSYVSRFMTLLPGDVISTGTPAGVGLGQRPPHYLRAGQTVRLGIEGLGEQCQQVVNDPAGVTG